MAWSGGGMAELPALLLLAKYSSAGALFGRITVTKLSKVLIACDRHTIGEVHSSQA